MPIDWNLASPMADFLLASISSVMYLAITSLRTMLSPVELTGR